MPVNNQPLSQAGADLGFGGDLLANQETEEEKRRKRLGLSSAGQNSMAAQQLLGFGQAGVASAMSLGASGGRAR